MKIYYNYQDGNKLADCKPQTQEMEVLEAIEGEEDSTSEDLLDL